MLPKHCLLAAVDLGSNSFRLEIDRYRSGYLKRKEYLREPVRLGKGLDHNMILSDSAMERGWAYLDKLGRHLHESDVHQVRAIATQTLRQAKNKDLFLSKGQELLGYPIEIISGEEEALLIYTGVTAILDAKKRHRNILSTEKRLVVDIGGRSTEVIVGQGSEALAAISLPVGSVGLSLDYFSDGRLTPQQFDLAIADAQMHFEKAHTYLKQNTLEKFQWDAAYGASGTIGAISNILRRSKISCGKITPDGLNWIYEQLLKAQHIDHIQLAGLGDRKDVVGGGLSTLFALFAVFKDLHSINPARGALRQGIIFEMTKNTSPCIKTPPL